MISFSSMFSREARQKEKWVKKITNLISSMMCLMYFCCAAASMKELAFVFYLQNQYFSTEVAVTIFSQDSSHDRNASS